MKISVIRLMGLLTGLWVLLSTPAIAQDEPEVTARFDRNTVYEGDSAVLRIEVSNLRLENGPDFSRLESDFVVGQTGTNSSMSIVNGRKEFRTEWNVLLEPRRTGDIEVPSLVVGPYRTQPLTLSVLPRPEGSGPQGRDVFMEVEATPEEAYVHGQVLFVIRLFHAPSIMEGSLGEPSGLEAVIERLGDDTDYRTVIDGQNYRVIERRYAIFPERSGTMTIPEIRFQGRVADRSNQNRGGFNSLFSRGRLTSVKSDPVTLNVKPRPDSYPGTHWLPAASFEVKEVWPNGEPAFRVGEPVTRMLVTEAKGLLSAQLPEFDLTPPDGAKIYPDQPVTQSRTDGSWVLGKREDRFAIVPTRPGTLTLPEVRVQWWDTVNNQTRESVIPSRQFEVLPGAESGVAPVDTVATVPQAVPVSNIVSLGTDPLWRNLALLAAALWLITLALYLRERRRPPAAGPAAPPPPQRDENVAGPKPFRKACQSDDPQAAARTLLDWVAAEDGGARNLGELAQRVEATELAEEIRRLDHCLYSREDERWTGDALWKMCRGGLRYREDQPQTRAEVLPALYPRH